MAARQRRLSPEDERSWRLNEAALTAAAADWSLCRNDTGKSRPPRERTARIARPRPALRRVGRAWTGRAASRGLGADRRRPAAAVAASARRSARPEAPVRDPARDEGPMRRADVAHILRASRSLTNETEFVLVGSQSPTCRSPTFRSVMRQSGELDIYPLRRPELAEVDRRRDRRRLPVPHDLRILCARRGPETAKLPRGWHDRALRISDPMTEGAIGIAPEIHDICASKLVALREKDFDYVGAAIEATLVEPTTLLTRLSRDRPGSGGGPRPRLAWVAAGSASGRRANVRDASGRTPQRLPPRAVPR